MFFILFPLCSLSSPYFSLSSFSFSVHYLALPFKFKKSFISMNVTVALLPKLCSGNTEDNCNSNFNHVNIHVCVYVTQTMCIPALRTVCCAADGFGVGPSGPACSSVAHL